MIVFDDNIAYTLSNKGHNPIATEVFIRGIKLSIFLVSITKFFCSVPKDIGLNLKYYFIIKIPKRMRASKDFIEYLLYR